MATAAPCGAPHQCPLVDLLVIAEARRFGGGRQAENVVRISLGMEPQDVPPPRRPVREAASPVKD